MAVEEAIEDDVGRVLAWVHRELLIPDEGLGLRPDGRSVSLRGIVECGEL